MQREEQKEAAGKPPPAAPTDQVDIAPPGAAPVQPTFIAPPRTIADITSILDSAKPDAAQIATRQQDADAAPPSNGSAENLADFYLHRASARALLARNKDALADALQGLTVGKSGVDLRTSARRRQLAAQQDRILGDPKSAVGLLDLQIWQGFVPGRQGTVINAMTPMTQTQILMGDVNQAATYAGRAEAMVQEARGSPNPKWREAYSKYGNAWESDADTVRGQVFEARGQYAEAETAYRRAEAFGGVVLLPVFLTSTFSVRSYSSSTSSIRFWFAITRPNKSLCASGWIAGSAAGGLGSCPQIVEASNSGATANAHHNRRVRGTLDRLSRM